MLYKRFSVLSQYCKKGSAYMEARGWTRCEKSRSIYYHFLNDVFMAYLRERGIKTFEGVTSSVLSDLQDYLLRKGNKGGTINRYFRVVKSVFSYCVMKGIIKKNPFCKVKALKERGNEARGCFEIEKLC